MGSKTVVLAGVAVSAALIYFCIDFKKDRISVACNLNKHQQKPVNQEPPVAVASSEEVSSKPAQEETVVFQKSDPAFGISMGDVFNIVGMFAPDAKEGRLISYVNELCAEKECINDIRYSDDIKSVSWDDTMIELINFFREEHMDDAWLYVNSNVVHIEGKIPSPEAKKRLDALITKLTSEGLRVENDTKSIVEEPTSEKIVEHIEEKIEKVQTIVEEKKSKKSETLESLHVEEKEQVQKSVEPVQSSAQKTEAKRIAKPVEKVVPEVEKPQVVEAKPVTQAAPVAVETKVPDTAASSSELPLQEDIKFDDRMNGVAPQSQKRLDEIAASLQNGAPVRVIVYAHASDDSLVNTIIAQKRAEIIKNYLRKKGVKVVGADGRGVLSGEEHIEFKIVK
jgi:outer membrane protein OmpA-like peptidoglycan-associated protein